MIETTVSQRRGLDSERQQKETEEQRRAREVRHWVITESPNSSLRLRIVLLVVQQLPPKYRLPSKHFIAHYAKNNLKL
jgi:hypothetical protein